jgi:hypothetical protein
MIFSLSIQALEAHYSCSVNWLLFIFRALKWDSSLSKPIYNPSHWLPGTNQTSTRAVAQGIFLLTWDLGLFSWLQEAFWPLLYVNRNPELKHSEARAVPFKGVSYSIPTPILEWLNIFRHFWNKSDFWFYRYPWCLSFLQFNASQKIYEWWSTVNEQQLEYSHTVFALRLCQRLTSTEADSQSQPLDWAKGPRWRSQTME